MKLFLSSDGLPEALRGAFLSLFETSADPPRVAFVGNAADVLPDELLSLVSARQAELAATGLQVRDLDLAAKRDAAGLRAALADVDALWCCGGNSSYLPYIAKCSGLGTSFVRCCRRSGLRGRLGGRGARDANASTSRTASGPSL
jgi:peptidase E